MTFNFRSFVFLISIYVAFFASGASSLIAEVTWNRMLIVVVGNSMSATAMIIGASTLVLVHLVFALTSLQPHFFLILLGISFSLVPAAMWPSMVKLVKDKEIGTAYGIMYSVQNLGLWGIPILAGRLLDKTNPGTPDTLDYTPTMLMFAALSLLGLFFAVILKWENSRGNYGIEQPLNKK